MRLLPEPAEWGWNALCVLAAAALMAAVLYAADVSLIVKPDAMPGMPEEAPSVLRSAQACVWESAKAGVCGAITPASFEPAPLFDRVQTYEALENNDLHRRVLRLRDKLRVDLNAVRHEADVVAVPLRDLAWRAGMAFRWDGVGPAHMRSRDGLVVVVPGENVCRRNFRTVDLPAPAFVREHELYLSLNSVAKAFQMQLARDSSTGIYTLTGTGAPLRVLCPADAFHIEIDRSERWINITYAGQFLKHYAACTGQGGNTPVGNFHIQNKSVWPGWRAYWGEFIPGGSSRNPLGARFLGTTARGRVTGWTIGIHGTNQPSSIGRRISGGCVRMLNRNIIELYEVIPIGTRVTIHE